METSPGHNEEPDGDPQGRQIKQHVNDYAHELELNSWRQAELHSTAAGFWGNFQWVFGGAAAVLAAVASGAAFSHYPFIAGILALCGAGSAAIVTALRPGDISAQHLKSAAGFNSLQNDARNLWEFEAERLDADESRSEVSQLGRRWNEIMEGSPRVPRRLFAVTDERYGKKGMYYFPKPRRDAIDKSHT
jgi:hypothetical protein